MTILLERPGRKPGQLVGRSPYMQAVHVMAPDSLIGDVVTLAITDAHGNSLSAELVTSPDGQTVKDHMRQNQTVKRAIA